MSLYQTDQPTPHPTQVRAIAYELALKETQRAVYSSEKLRDAAVEVAAKRIEKYLWGGFAPIELPPTPLSTIAETATHLLGQIRELAKNTASTKKALELHEVAGQIERIQADIERVLS